MAKTFFAIYLGKLVSFLSQLLNLGSGETWSGEIALKIEPRLLEKLTPKISKIIIVAGTNGKTTTVKILKNFFGNKAFSNKSGANLLNGMAGSLVQNYPFRQKEIAVFEVDEAVFPKSLNYIKADVIVLLNLFRDQLDRYGEVNALSQKWQTALRSLPKETLIILNADDPQVANLGNKSKANVFYFGFNSIEKMDKEPEFWGDSIYCPNCGQKLYYKNITFSHLGNWYCKSCGLTRPSLSFDASSVETNLEGIHNQYNAAAATLVAQKLNIDQRRIDNTLNNLAPAYGRWENLNRHKMGNHLVTLVLSKNPTGLTQNLRLLSEKKDIGTLLIILNDRIPDGTDVSWIWDISFKELTMNYPIIVSGDRYLDMALRLKYEGIDLKNLFIESNLKEALKKAFKKTEENKRTYIIATYSAMLETRRLLVGRKIL